MILVWSQKENFDGEEEEEDNDDENDDDFVYCAILHFVLTNGPYKYFMSQKKSVLLL